MKSSTRTVLKSISFSLGFNAVSWLSFGFLYANYSTHNYAIYAPMIAGVLAIPLYFILKMNCDDFYSSVVFFSITDQFYYVPVDFQRNRSFV